MKLFRELPAWRAGLLCAGMALLVAVRTLPAEEPAQEFLNQLREAHYFDTALDYIEQLKTSPIAPAKIREVLDYEKGVTLVAGAKHQRDFGLREKQLDEAQAALDAFSAAQPEHALATSAKSQLANLVAERARLKLERSKRPGEANKDKLKGEAKELFTKAYDVFNGLYEDLKNRHEAIPKVLDPQKDRKQIEYREQLRSDILITLLTRAAVLEESAELHESGSAEYKSTLEKAGKEYGALYEKYRTKLAGMYARMYQGRAAQKLGNLKDALSYYDELLQQPHEQRPLFTLKTKVLLLAIDCWMAESQKKYAEIVNRGSAWIDLAIGADVRSDDFMALRMAVAQASKLYADQLRKEKPKDPQAAALINDARKLAQYVARFPGDHQKNAQKLLGELGVATAQPGANAQPKTFADARQAGREALEAYQVHKLNLDTLPAQIKNEKDATAKQEMEKTLAESQAAIKISLGDALQYFELAMKLADAEVSDDDRNAIRYYLAILHFFQADYYDAAVIGSFVAERYPDSGGARQCAKIAMSSYIQLFNVAKAEAKGPIEKLLADLDEDKDLRISLEELKKGTPEDQARFAGADVDGSGKLDSNELLRTLTRFESEHIMEVATYITTKWPDQPEAQESLGTLIAFMIGENQLEKAQAYLDKIPVDSSQRGSAELKMGEALWRAYTRGMAEVREQEQTAASTGGGLDAATTTRLAARKQELADLKGRAEKTLVEGVARMEKTGRVDSNFAQAVLSLSVIFVDTEQAGKAVELLERENVGPLALVKNKHESAQRNAYVEETYRTALRAYISALAGADAKQGDALIEKAEGIMDGLKEAVGTNEDGQKRLTSIYLALAHEIEQQMKLASADAKKNLAKGFETFLDRVGAESKDLNTLLWVGQTYYSMGDNLEKPKGGGASPDAKRYFGKAAKTYEDLLDRAGKKQIEIDDTKKGQLRMQLAKTKRSMEDYEGAIKLFIALLSEKNTLLSVQIEAAKTYDEWAERSGDSKHYMSAVLGSRDQKNKESTIWGWTKMATVANRAGIRDAFYDARYHLTLSLYKYALMQKDAAKKEKDLTTAENALAQTYKLFPAIDGDPAENRKSFREQYDGLAKAIQRALKKREAGLAAYAVEVPKPEGTAKPGTGGATKPAAGATGAAGASKPAAGSAKPTTGPSKPATGAAAPAKPTGTPAKSTSATSKK